MYSFMEKLNINDNTNGRRKPGLLKMIKERLINLFRPEEVEVTFTEEGRSMKYTYTVLTHKRVA